MTAIKNHNKKNSYFKLTLITLILLSCSKNPIEKGSESDALKVEYAFTRSIGQNTAEVLWKCSSKSYGVITYGKTGLENPQFVFFKSDIQYYQLTGLSSGSIYNYQVGCMNERKAVYFIQKFQTLPTPNPPLPGFSFPTISNPTPSFPAPPYFSNLPTFPQIAIDRGIWLVGGIGFSNTPIAQIDVYDPVGDIWYSAITNIPTPRSYTGVASLNGKIYVIGGMTASFSVSSLVEEYTPSTNTWKTLAAAPVSIQGALAAVSGNSIYLIGGSVTTSSAAAIPNVVYKFTPDSSTGSWTTITSSSAIPARIDFSGCSMYGTLFFNSGRDTTGTAQFASDAYIPSSNSTTGITEGNFSLSRFGTSSTCYRPKPTDPFPSDSPGVFLVGGSTLGNTAQPPSAIISSNRFDYYLTPSGTNTVLTGPNFPVNAYAPAAEISYELRRLYVFGGSSVVNVPTNTVYWLDLNNPATGPWASLTTVMPTARFGHSAVLLNR